MPRLLQTLKQGRLFALVLLAAVIAVRMADPSTVQVMRMRSFDVLQELFPREAQDQPVAIVDISWGAFVTAVSSTAGLLVANWLVPKV